MGWIGELIIKLKNRFPPDVNWKYQKQTTPPTFGWAKLVDENYLQNAIAQRKGHCQEVIKNSASHCNYVPGKVSLIVLTCKRMETLERLLVGMKSFFNNIEKFENIEKILVDNGSGEDYIKKIQSYGIFDKIVAHKNNLGMTKALRDIFRDVDGEYILYIEDDFLVDYDKPFISNCIELFNEYPEIGIIRLKNLNNWWKAQRVIGPQRETSSGNKFWTWLPSKDGMLNIWAAGSVMFRTVSYFSVGELPDIGHLPRIPKKHGGYKAYNGAYVYEYIYGKQYNQKWLAAKFENICPFFQPNNNDQSPGWSE